MIQARKLGHVVLKGADAQKSKEFYMRALGLKVANDAQDRGAVFLSFGTQHHDLACSSWPPAKTPDAEQPGLHHTRGSSGASKSCRPLSRARQARHSRRVRHRAQRDPQHLLPRPRRQPRGALLRHVRGPASRHADDGAQAGRDDIETARCSAAEPASARATRARTSLRRPLLRLPAESSTSTPGPSPLSDACTPRCSPPAGACSI